MQIQIEAKLNGKWQAVIVGINVTDAAQAQTVGSARVAQAAATYNTTNVRWKFQR